MLIKRCVFNYVKLNYSKYDNLVIEFIFFVIFEPDINTGHCKMVYTFLITLH